MGRVTLKERCSKHCLSHVECLAKIPQAPPRMSSGSLYLVALFAYILSNQGMSEVLGTLIGEHKMGPR